MAVRIGHASISENGTVRNGSAGDQTGKEVCTRSWYSRNWSVMLRPKSADLAEKSAQACEKGCANGRIGYDQNQRNALHTEAQKVGYNLAKITTPCETDCSAFMTVCAIAGGAKNLEYTGNAPTTSTMRKAFGKTGLYEVHTESKYLTSDKYLKRGDILVAEGKHTVMVLENGSGSSVASTRILRQGSKGEDVRQLQIKLNAQGYQLVIDGDFGSRTLAAVRDFQRKNGLEADGIVGSATRKALGL